MTPFLQLLAAAVAVGGSDAVVPECRATGLIPGNRTADAGRNARALQAWLARCSTVRVGR